MAAISYVTRSKARETEGDGGVATFSTLSTTHQKKSKGKQKRKNSRGGWTKGGVKEFKRRLEEQFVLEGKVRQRKNRSSVLHGSVQHRGDGGEGRRERATTKAQRKISCGKRRTPLNTRFEGEGEGVQDAGIANRKKGGMPTTGQGYGQLEGGRRRSP